MGFVTRILTNHASCWLHMLWNLNMIQMDQLGSKNFPASWGLAKLLPTSHLIFLTSWQTSQIIKLKSKIHAIRQLLTMPIDASVSSANGIAYNFQLLKRQNTVANLFACIHLKLITNQNSWVIFWWLLPEIMYVTYVCLPPSWNSASRHGYQPAGTVTCQLGSCQPVGLLWNNISWE